MKVPARNNLVVELHVPNFEPAKSFYTKLGFVVTLVDEPTPEEKGYMTLTLHDPLGSAMLNFYGGDERVYDQSYFKQFPRETKRGYAAEVTFPVSDIEKIYKLATDLLPNSIVREIREMRDHDHVWRDFRMEDPYGFYIRFTDLVDWGQGSKT